ncbi:NAD(P)-dependent oxidoreductase [Hymenobacter sp. HSC-4F20]|uniref:SDR family oxidoreductase n=1 Tax=Hymenobacter sp. HSC-4F20 TaxID=2864135 RepID=UPI001C72BA1D|nr:NAD(P)-dependent oxidoreductase [Hymenobacter sp. HSC-4F20]MBX0291064.1 NAD(P)-dependent oxidoreductase [Hymenobacter sp. HSC-4F20]
MKILVTGSNGLLGQKLIALLRQQPQVEVIATSRGSNKLAALYPDVRFLSLDVTDATQVATVLAHEKPTHLIHTAAMTNVDECQLNQEACWALNVTAVSYLVAACQRHHIHLVHISTDFVFSGSEGPLTEEAQPAPINFYGESKLAAEKLVQACSTPWAILRTALVYGVAHDYGRTNIVLWVRDSLQAGRAIKVVNDQYRTPTLAEDLAQGCWLAAERNATGIFNISSHELFTPYQLAQQVAAFFDLDANLLEKVDASTFSQPATRPLRTGFIITKAEQELGFRPRTFREGIALLASQTEPGP